MTMLVTCKTKEANATTWAKMEKRHKKTRLTKNKTGIGQVVVQD